MRPHRRRQLAYAALSAADTWLAGTGRRRARLLTKPLLMPALAAVTAARPEPDPKVWAALAGSWAGDVALMRSGPEAFVGGASAFAVGQAGWLSALRGHTRPGAMRSPATLGLAGVWASTLPVAVMAGRQHRPLGLVLAGYGAALCAVSAVALNLAPEQPVRAARAAQTGALLFLLSDGLIGLHRFVLDTDNPRWDGAVMATYTAAQLLLEEGVAGLSHHPRRVSG